jgi:ribosomal protein S1
MQTKAKKSDASKAKVRDDSKTLRRTSFNGPSREIPKAGYKRRQLKVGDKVQVYVKFISKQSGRFMVTMDPEVRKPKEVKREHAVEKKLTRLAQQLGGSLDRISHYVGRECSGIVKATSQTSDWLYVQPQLENLPVGVGTLSPVLKQREDEGGINIKVGDAVNIRLDGIDEERGQLAMTVLGKLAP